uniref:Kinetochore protein SPC25 n=2 Tax=Clastoptera arizonana TaxID=38151 RepID=A0A1B6EBB0_9HEMI
MDQLEDLKFRWEEQSQQACCQLEGSCDNILKIFQNCDNFLDNLVQKKKGSEEKCNELRELLNNTHLKEENLKKDMKELTKLKEEYDFKFDLMTKNLEDVTKDIPKENEIQELKNKELLLKEELNSKVTEMKLEFDTFKHVIKCYQIYFDCHIYLEEPNYVIFEFEKRQKKDVKSEYFVKLKQSLCDGKEYFELVDLHKKLSCHKNDLAKKLQDTKDVAGLLVFVRNQYKLLMEKN